MGEGLLWCQNNASKRPRKILSDIDDTLCCSGGHFPAGVDRRFPKRCVYPGVLALFRELGQYDQEDVDEVDEDDDEDEADATPSGLNSGGITPSSCVSSCVNRRHLRRKTRQRTNKK